MDAYASAASGIGYKVRLYSIWLSHMVVRSQKGTHFMAEL